MLRYLSLIKFAWLIVWNLALLVLLVVVPVVALFQAGWFAAGFMAMLAVLVLALRRPAFLMGMWLGSR